MRVLHLHSGNLYGGVETSLLALARCRHLAPSMELAFGLCFEGRIAAELRAAGVRTDILGPVRLRRPDTVWRARRALAALLKRERFDVVIPHQSWPQVIFGPVARAAGVPVVLWMHTSEDGRRWLDRRAWRLRPDCIVCNSKFTMSQLPRMKTRVECIYHPLDEAVSTDPGDRARLRAELTTSADTVVIVQVTRMEPRKGHRVCIEALGQLRETAGWTCWQVGGPQQPKEVAYLENLRKAAEEFGVADRIRFAGERSDVARFLNAADICCHPHTEPEPFGISLIEAMSAGLPVVTSATGGPLEFVDDTCGVLVPPGDPQALADALRALIQDRAMRARLSHHARERRRALCDPDVQMRRIVELLEDVTSNRGAALVGATAPRDKSPTMRVLHIHSGNLYGGVETFLVTLARCRHLAPSMDMTVALCFEGRVASELRAEGVPTLMLGAVRLRRPDTVWRARHALASLLQHGRFDVVVCQQAWPHVVFGRTIREAGAPTVLWVHTAEHGRHWLNRWGRRNQPDRIVCNSQFTMSMILGTGIRGTGPRVEYVYCPVINHARHLDPSERARLRAELGTAPHDLVIIQVGRLEPWKGQAVCIEALARLRERPGWRCWQIGGPQQPREVRYFNELREAAARLGVADRITFAGERTDVDRLLQAADIYCQPNTQPEPFGLTFVEALSAGLPIVTSAAGGALEVVTDQCGVLVPPCDPDAVAAALRRLIEDPELRARLGHHALERRKALCDPREQMERIAGLLEDVTCRGVIQ